MIGDRIAEALARAGVTEERVSRWLGRKCNCRRRKEKLNALEAWARRVLKGKAADAKKYLDEMIGEQ